MTIPPPPPTKSEMGITSIEQLQFDQSNVCNEFNEEIVVRCHYVLAPEVTDISALIYPYLRQLLAENVTGYYTGLKL